MVSRKIYITLLFFGCMQIAHAQQSAAVKALARIQENKVILRWAPLSERGWNHGNQYGYTIERFTISKNGIIDTLGVFEKRVITTDPIKPWPLENWEAIMNESFIPIAAQALYGERFEVSATKNFQQFLEQKRENENRFGFALLAADHSAQAATAMGLRFEDQTCQAGEKYLYTIYVSQQDKNYPIDTAFVIADMNQEDVLEEVKDLNAHFGDRYVRLSWDIFHYQDTYTSYQIEKSEDGKHFYPLNEMPLIQTSATTLDRKMMFIDSLAQNEQTYYYRLRGLTPFGETGPPSLTLKGKGVASLKGNTAIIDSINILENGNVHLFWHLAKEYKHALSAYEILRGSSDRGPFESASGLIKANKAHEFIDEHMNGSTAYYMVKAIGKDSLSTLSFPQLVQKEDNTPPNPPSELQGSIDKNGKVYIEWKKGQEADLLGYRIFNANSLDEEFALVSHHTTKDTYFEDSLQTATLNKEVYYKLIALDHHLNPSAYSEILTLKKPDVIPPVAAIITHVESKEGSISIQWQASPSEDASDYEVLRLENNKRTYQLLSTLMHVQDSLYCFKDTLITAGESYRYILRTKDESGHNSDHPSITVQAIDPGKRSAVEDIHFDLKRDARQLSLHWKYEENNKVKGYRIYRAFSEQGTLRLYKYTEAKLFTDQHLQINNTYRYAIQAIFEDDTESQLSEEISIVY